MGRIWDSPKRLVWSSQNTPTCVSFGFSMLAARTAFCTPSIHDGLAILLIGGDKTGDNRWYDIHVPMADRLYDEYIEEIRKEGLI
ncbi:hypothetical protein BH24GEM2_BH24GEM2_10650 [soil metagenome]